MFEEAKSELEQLFDLSRHARMLMDFEQVLHNCSNELRNRHYLRSRGCVQCRGTFYLKVLFKKDVILFRLNYFFAYFFNVPHSWGQGDQKGHMTKFL